MPMIEISQDAYDLLAQAARFEMMHNRETDDFEEATPDELANAVIWQAAQNIIRKHRDEDNLRIGALPDEIDDQIPF